LIGSNFIRDPPGSTERYQKWCNELDQKHLYLHQFRECTMIQPTWFLKRSTFEKIGKYDEGAVGTPEDLIFFLEHLKLGGWLYKIEKPLVTYRYHDQATSFKVHRLKMLEIRTKHFEERIISQWKSFSIWGCGRDGKKFYSFLSVENKRKVAAFADINPNLIGNMYNNLQNPEIRM